MMKSNDLRELISGIMEKDNEKVAAEIVTLNCKIRNEQMLMKRLEEELERVSDRAFRAGMKYAIDTMKGETK